MPLSVVQHEAGPSGASGTSTSVTLSQATGAGNLIVALVVSTGTISGVTDGTSSFTQFPSARVNATGSFAGVQYDVYYLASSNSGKTSITLNSSSASFLEIEVWEVSGFTTPATDGTTNNGTAGANSGASTDLTGPGLGTSAAGFIAAGCGVNTGNIGLGANPKAGNAFTSGGNTPNTDGFVSLITSGSGTYTPVWTNNTTNDDYLVWIAAFKESSGASTVAMEWKSPDATTAFLNHFRPDIVSGV